MQPLKKQITILESIILIALFLFIAMMCNTSQDVSHDKQDEISQHDSTLLKNYELTH